MKTFTVHFEIPSYLGGGTGSAEIPANSMTEAILKMQEAFPRMMVNRQMVNSNDARAAGYQRPKQTIFLA